MKPQAVNENDLLALIEGDLDAARAQVVRTALAKDPRLIERVALMQADREAIRWLFSDAQMDAPGGLVRDAIAIAEREGLIVEAPRPAAANIVIKRRSVSRSMAAGLAMAAMVGVLGTGAVLVISLSKSDEQLAAEAADSPEYLLSVPTDEEPIDDMSQFASQLLPGPSNAGSEAIDRLATALAREDGPKGEELAGPIEYAVTHGVPTLRRQAVHPWAGILEDEDMGVSVYEAAQLAMSSRLELTILAQDPGTWAQMNGQVLAMGDLQATTGQPDFVGHRSREPMHFTIEITVPWDANLTALQDELLRLRGRVMRRRGVSQAMFQEVVQPEVAASSDSSSEQQLAAGVLPSREVQHVLWWTRPASSWQRYLSVRVPIMIVPTDKAP